MFMSLRLPFACRELCCDFSLASTPFLCCCTLSMWLMATCACLLISSTLRDWGAGFSSMTVLSCVVVTGSDNITVGPAIGIDSHLEVSVIRASDCAGKFPHSASSQQASLQLIGSMNLAALACLCVGFLILLTFRLSVEFLMASSYSIISAMSSGTSSSDDTSSGISFSASNHLDPVFLLSSLVRAWISSVCLSTHLIALPFPGFTVIQSWFPTLSCAVV